jgi:hypothetical protein
MNNITSWDIYWILKLDEIIEVCRMIAIFSIFFAFVVGVICMIEKDDTGMICNCMKLFRLFCLITVLFGAVALFLPTTRQCFAMSYGPNILNSKLVKEDLPEEVKEIYQSIKQQYLPKSSEE